MTIKNNIKKIITLSRNNKMPKNISAHPGAEKNNKKGENKYY